MYTMCTVTVMYCDKYWILSVQCTPCVQWQWCTVMQDVISEVDCGKRCTVRCRHVKYTVEWQCSDGSGHWKLFKSRSRVCVLVILPVSRWNKAPPTDLQIMKSPDRQVMLKTLLNLMMDVLLKRDAAVNFLIYSVECFLIGCCHRCHLATVFTSKCVTGGSGFSESLVWN